MSGPETTTRDVTKEVIKVIKEGPLKVAATKAGLQFHTQWEDSVTLESAIVTGNHVKMRWRFEVQYEYCNPANMLHGAAQAVFYDQTMACLALPLRKPGFWEELGFTRNLNINFLRTAKLGEFIIMDVEVTQIGQMMCYLQGTMKRERDGALISTCEQNKFNSQGGGMMAKL